VARRSAPPAAVDDCPEWVYSIGPTFDRDSGRIVYWDPTEAAWVPRSGVGHVLRLIRAHHPDIEAQGGSYWAMCDALTERAEAWCRDHRLSAARTMRGARWPTAEEQAAGQIRGAGPKWTRVVAYCREHGLDYAP
jgi:hypothetical protein